MKKTKEKSAGKGYVLISRGLLEHKRFKPECALTKFEAWYWLIEKAAYVARTVTVINGRHHAAVVPLAWAVNVLGSVSFRRLEMVRSAGATFPGDSENGWFY
jgi:hypothetical protein